MNHIDSLPDYEAEAEEVQFLQEKGGKTMSRYIDSEAIMEIARDGYHSDFGRSMADLTSLEELIEDTPTADVVEVVRCKDCTEWNKDEHECSHWYGFREDDYCSYGERMDGETE